MYDRVLNNDLANSQVSPYETTAPRVLHARGYKSAMFGKFHLAGPYNYPTQYLAPHDAGFDYFYGDLEGCAQAPRYDRRRPPNSTGTYPCGFVQDARFGACRFADGRCPTRPPGRLAGPRARPVVPRERRHPRQQPSCGHVGAFPGLQLYNGYYVAPLDTIDDAGNLTPVPTTVPRARRYLTIHQTDAAIDWISRRSRPRERPSWRPSATRQRTSRPAGPTSIVPDQPAGPASSTARSAGTAHPSEPHDRSHRRRGGTPPPHVRGFTTRDAGGNLVYDPANTDTMIIIVGDNGTYGLSVKVPFDPSRAKGFTYQTGVWVPLITAGPS